jgi:hypothetical protein
MNPMTGLVKHYMARKRKGRRFDPKKDRCYMCAAPATSDEHVPPRSFFPERLQGKRLLTVPACATHNNSNAGDVEYVRGVLCIQYNTNATAEEVSERAEASWDHSPKLFNRTFEGMLSAEVVGGETVEEIGVFTVDLPRVKRVMEAIAHALYYLERGHAWPGTFEVFCAFHSERSLHGLPDGSERRGRLFCARSYSVRETLHPDVFELRVHASEPELIFAMRFYAGPWIYARRLGAVITSAGRPRLVRV